MSRNVDNKRPLTINLTIPFLLLFFLSLTPMFSCIMPIPSPYFEEKNMLVVGNKQKQNIHERKDVKKKVKKKRAEIPISYR